MTEKLTSKSESELLMLIEEMINVTEIILHSDENLNDADMARKIIKVIEKSYGVEF